MNEGADSRISNQEKSQNPEGPTSDTMANSIDHEELKKPVKYGRENLISEGFEELKWKSQDFQEYLAKELGETGSLPSRTLDDIPKLLDTYNNKNFKELAQKSPGFREYLANEDLRKQSPLMFRIEVAVAAFGCGINDARGNNSNTNSIFRQDQIGRMMEAPFDLMRKALLYHKITFLATGEDKTMAETVDEWGVPEFHAFGTDAKAELETVFARMNKNRRSRAT